MAKQYSKNLEKVQSMIDGTYGSKIQSGYTGEVQKTRKVGDTWTDSDGMKWEQKDGFRVNHTKLANRGIADHKCSDCDKFIIKPWDKEIFKFNDRCYYCQIDFEAELKTSGKFDAWKEAQDKRIKEDYIKKFEEENKELVKEIANLENPFDTKVANALANENVTMEINKNTK
ncbi:MAG: hypothetical protein H8E55_57090 [Pelagibacterales bacterium]|nr:hypothetical protein [Pelagibacterales bacterium]